MYLPDQLLEADPEVAQLKCIQFKMNLAINPSNKDYDCKSCTTLPKGISIFFIFPRKGKTDIIELLGLEVSFRFLESLPESMKEFGTQHLQSLLLITCEIT